MKLEKIKFNKFIFNKYETLVISNAVSDWLDVHKDDTIEDDAILEILNEFVNIARRNLE